MDTDAAWEKLARSQPYWAVLSHPEFGGRSLSDKDEERFFQTGSEHVAAVIGTIRAHVAADFTPACSLDYGCGVGRVLPALAEVSRKVHGFDVSPTMLEHAARHLSKRGVTNVDLHDAGELARFDAQVDFVHSVLVLQHVNARRGLGILARLAALLVPGGCGWVQLRLRGPGGRLARGVRDLRSRSALLNRVANSALRRPPDDALVLMHEYDLAEVLSVLAQNGVPEAHVQTLVGASGPVDATVYFRKP